MRLYVEGGRGLDDLHLLHRWLVRDPEAQLAGPRLAYAAPRPGGMGVGLELVDFTVGTGLNVTAVVLAVAAWLRPRVAVAPRRPDADADAGNGAGAGPGAEPASEPAAGDTAGAVRVIIEHDGTTVTLSGASEAEVAAVLTALRKG